MCSVLGIVIHKLICFMTHSSWKRTRLQGNISFYLELVSCFIHFPLLLFEKQPQKYYSWVEPFKKHQYVNLHYLNCTIIELLFCVHT